MLDSVLLEWEQKLKNHVALHQMTLEHVDPSHDLAHFERVAANARTITQNEGGRLEVVLPAAWLHDIIHIAKDDPRASQASRLSAAAAVRLLRSMSYPEEFYDDIAHAIEAHSFSSRIEPMTLEARIVQDADRLDALGAVGVARCFGVGAQMGAQFYNPTDPMGRNRELDDKKYSLDHFFTKLFPVIESLKTKTGREEGLKRMDFMRAFVAQITNEIRGLSPVMIADGNRRPMPKRLTENTASAPAKPAKEKGSILH